MFKNIPLHQHNLGDGLPTLRPTSAPSRRGQSLDLFFHPDGDTGPPPLTIGFQKHHTRSKPWNQREPDGFKYYQVPERSGDEYRNHPAPAANWRTDDEMLQELLEAAEVEKKAVVKADSKLGDELAAGENSSFRVLHENGRPQTADGPIGTRTAQYDMDGAGMDMRRLYCSRATLERKKQYDTEAELAKTRALLAASRAEVRNRDGQIAKLTRMCESLKNNEFLDAQAKQIEALTEALKCARSSSKISVGARSNPKLVENAPQTTPKVKPKPKQEPYPHRQRGSRTLAPARRNDAVRPGLKRIPTARKKRTKSRGDSVVDVTAETGAGLPKGNAQIAEESLVDLGSEHVLGRSFDCREKEVRVTAEESQLGLGSEPGNREIEKVLVATEAGVGLKSEGAPSESGKENMLTRNLGDGLEGNLGEKRAWATEKEDETREGTENGESVVENDRTTLSNFESASTETSSEEEKTRKDEDGSGDEDETGESDDDDDEEEEEEDIGASQSTDK